MFKLRLIVIFMTAPFFVQGTIAAQDTADSNTALTSQPIDEIIVKGTAGWASHDGMDAFLSGDFETAEIIFEKEFISLKRAENGRYNAAVDAALSINRANNISQSTNNAASSAVGGRGNLGATTNQLSSTSNLSGRSSSGQGKKERNILNDGILSDKDFAVTKYMSGLSEIKLGKYKEAKKSLKTSLHYYSSNPDARMRLGLLYLKENNYDKAADQLEKLERRRVKCKKKNCDKYDEILDAASILATEISNKIHSK